MKKWEKSTGLSKEYEISLSLNPKIGAKRSLDTLIKRQMKQ